jgi:hypothetical protein
MAKWGAARFYHADEDWEGWSWFLTWPSRATGYSRSYWTAFAKAAWNSTLQAIFGMRNHPKWYWWK